MKPGQGLKRGTSTMKRTAMKPGSKAMERAAKPIRARSRTNADPRPKTGEAALCKGQPCYLRLPGLFCSSKASVVPCHSNQEKHGKGMGHRELDQGNRFTRAEKFALWDDAYKRWQPVRAQLQLEQAARRAKRRPSSASVTAPADFSDDIYQNTCT
jgi:hypothetical protein